jgi:tagaturonate reductase
MKTVGEFARTYDNPVRIIQFGEGNFLRAFWGKAIHELNGSGAYAGQICVVQPIPAGRVAALADQNYLYTVMLQGPAHEEVSLVESIKTGINPYENYEAFLAQAEDPHLRIMISNTTEAGIVLDPSDSIEGQPPRTFPGKLLAFLYRRYTTFSGRPGSGLLHFPCELIENNGNELKRILLELASSLKLEMSFIEWVDRENVFFNTLVDCIVTGYPHDEADSIARRLGYNDPLLVKAEAYQLLVISGDDSYRHEFPISEASMKVVWTDDLAYYREIKVRIMNGFQTMLAHCGFLAGIHTEREALNHPVVGPFMVNGLYECIVPALPFAEKDKLEFAQTMLKRLDNPNIKHVLQDINLNSFTKFQTRLQPSLEYWAAEGAIPDFLLFSLALVLSLYQIDEIEEGQFSAAACGRRYPVFDTPENLELLHHIRQQVAFSDVHGYCRALIHEKRLWRKPLPLSDAEIERTSALLERIEEYGVLKTIAELSSKGTVES